VHAVLCPISVFRFHHAQAHPYLHLIFLYDFIVSPPTIPDRPSRKAAMFRLIPAALESSTIFVHASPSGTGDNLRAPTRFIRMAAGGLENDFSAGTVFRVGVDFEVGGCGDGGGESEKGCSEESGSAHCG
jgi:hypothetical protein